MAQSATRPRVTCIIPTIGRQAQLLTTVRDLCNQDIDAWECLIVAQGTLDESPFHALSNPPIRDIRLLACPEPNASMARNIGLREAQAPIVLFLDDDLRITREDFLTSHLRNFEDPNVSGVFGQVLGPSGLVRQACHPWSRKPRVGWLYFSANSSSRCRVQSGGSGNLSVRRDWAISVGGMDAQFEKGAHREESDFCLRYCSRYGDLVFDPDASVIHLGATVGGCRSWGQNRGVHPMHHVTGEWYFILKNVRDKRIPWRDLPHHLTCLVSRQVLNDENRSRPLSLAAAAGRSVAGMVAAVNKIASGPRYLE